MVRVHGMGLAQGWVPGMPSLNRLYWVPAPSIMGLGQKDGDIAKVEIISRAVRTREGNFVPGAIATLYGDGKALKSYDVSGGQLPGEIVPVPPGISMIKFIVSAPNYSTTEADPGYVYDYMGITRRVLDVDKSSVSIVMLKPGETLKQQSTATPIEPGGGLRAAYALVLMGMAAIGGIVAFVYIKKR